MKWSCVALLVVALSLAQFAIADPGRSDELTPYRALVVIDPGHGGSNQGAPGVVEGVLEKRLTLSLSRKVASSLRERGFRVALTRERDEYLTLRQRVGFANTIGADLLVSVHFNASATHSQRGYETFILSHSALDVDARALRYADGAPHLGADREIAALLDDVEQGVAMAAAAKVAAAVQRELRVLRGDKGDRGVRQQSMHVLLGATMPAVLVEVGFIDHADEGREMVDEVVHDKLATAIADAIAASL
jgi:N-acetylmuramoyl-L-alanine amidase